MAAAGLSAIPSVKVKPPRVAASPIHLECKHLQTIKLPDGRDGLQNRVVIGQVVGVHVADEVISDGIIDVSRVKPLARLGYLDYALIDKVFQMPRPD
jgi:flavin reductase (DIM6/NTAB) family NADH-FMN oxidoreductase RutF